MNYTDEQLKQVLAKMIPETCYMTQPDNKLLAWKDGHLVRDTELLHLCWLVEEGLENKLNLNYYNLIVLDPHASWQQRVKALAKVKGIEI